MILEYITSIYLVQSPFINSYRLPDEKPEKRDLSLYRVEQIYFPFVLTFPGWTTFVAKSIINMIH